MAECFADLPEEHRTQEVFLVLCKAAGIGEPRAVSLLDFAANLLGAGLVKKPEGGS